MSWQYQGQTSLGLQDWESEKVSSANHLENVISRPVRIYLYASGFLILPI